MTPPCRSEYKARFLSGLSPHDSAHRRAYNPWWNNYSKFELLCLFNKYCKLCPVSITPSDKLHLDKTLVCARTDFDFTVPSYEQMIIEMKDWIYSHKNIYPDYYYL